MWRIERTFHAFYKRKKRKTKKKNTFRPFCVLFGLIFVNGFQLIFNARLTARWRGWRFPPPQQQMDWILWMVWWTGIHSFTHSGRPSVIQSVEQSKVSIKRQLQIANAKCLVLFYYIWFKRFESDMCEFSLVLSAFPLQLSLPFCHRATACGRVTVDFPLQLLYAKYAWIKTDVTAPWRPLIPIP